MKRLIVFLLLSTNISVLYSQTARYPRDKTYSFSFFEGQISDTSKLELKVRYTNYEKEVILNHKSLVEDYEYGPVGNVYLEMEKVKDRKYEKFVDKSFDYFFEENRPQNRSDYNELKPGDSVVLSFNLINRIGAFYKGKYRIRIHLLKVPNNFPVNYEIGYVISRWFYFEVIKDLDYPSIYFHTSP